MHNRLPEHEVYSSDAWTRYGLAGCSTAAYRNEIKDFNASTDKVISTMKSRLDDTPKLYRRNQVIREFKEKKRAAIDLSGDCGPNGNLGPCRITMNGKPLAPRGNENMEGFRTLLSLFSAYASHLEGLVTAQDVDALNEKSKFLEEIVKSLTDILNNSREWPDKCYDVEDKSFLLLSKLAELMNLYKKMRDYYFSYKRWQVLKYLTSIMQEVLTDKTFLLICLESQTRDGYIDVKRDAFELNSASMEFQPENQHAQFVLLTIQLSEADEVADLVNTKPAQMFVKMITAHGELTKAIADPKRQIPSLIKARQDFRKAVGEVDELF